MGLTLNETFTMVFDSAIYSFGALFAGVNNGTVGNPRSTVSFNFSDGTTLEYGAENGWLTQTDDFTARFWGFISESPFSSVTFRGLGRSEGFGIDNVQWSSARPPTPVPVPASGLLLMGAMVVAGFFGRRRARA